MSDRIVLTWQRFTLMSEACKSFKQVSCVYVIADRSHKPLYIGEAGGMDGLSGRYRGGTAHAMDAAMSGSGNTISVAPVAADHRTPVQNALIYAEQPPHNRQGKIIPLSDLGMDSVEHQGDVPAFQHRK